MESWLGERIRKRLGSRKEQLQLVLTGQEKSCAQDSDEEDRPPPTDILLAVTNNSAGSSAETESPASALVVRQKDCRPVSWWPRFIGLSTREVSREDAAVTRSGICNRGAPIYETEIRGSARHFDLFRKKFFYAKSVSDS